MCPQPVKSMYLLKKSEIMNKGPKTYCKHLKLKCSPLMIFRIG